MSQYYDPGLRNRMLDSLVYDPCVNCGHPVHYLALEIKCAKCGRLGCEYCRWRCGDCGSLLCDSCECKCATESEA